MTEPSRDDRVQYEHILRELQGKKKSLQQKHYKSPLNVRGDVDQIRYLEVL